MQKTGLIKNVLFNFKNDEQKDHYNNNEEIIKKLYNDLSNILFDGLNKIEEISIGKCCKINYYDVFYLMFIKSSFKHSYQSIIDEIYCKNNFSLSDTALRKRNANISIEFYKKIFDNLKKLFYECNDSSLGKNLCCDGTESSCYILLKSYEFNSVPTDKYCEVFVSTLYDSDNEYPIDFSVSKTLNERDSFLCLLHNVNKFDIVLFDRGYPCFTFMRTLNDRGIRYIIRATLAFGCVKEIKKNNKKFVFKDFKGNKEHPPFRLIKQTIDQSLSKFYEEDHENEYYFFTNIYDIEPSEIQLLYFKRWKIEIFYDKFKNNVDGKFLYTQSEKRAI